MIHYFILPGNLKLVQVSARLSFTESGLIFIVKGYLCPLYCTVASTQKIDIKF